MEPKCQQNNTRKPSSLRSIKILVPTSIFRFNLVGLKGFQVLYTYPYFPRIFLLRNHKEYNFVPDYQVMFLRLKLKLFHVITLYYTYKYLMVK